MLPSGTREGAGIADGVAGSHVSLRDAPLSRDLAEFEVVAPPHRERRRRAAVFGCRRLHLSNNVYFSVRALAIYDDHEVAEAVVGPVEPRYRLDCPAYVGLPGH